MANPIVFKNQRVNVDSKTCPQVLRLVLRAQLRDIIARRRSTRTCIASNYGLDALLDLWWEHHQNIIRAASIRPEWDWATLSLHFNKDVARPVNFYDALKDFLVLLGRPHYEYAPAFYDWSYNISCPVVNSPSHCDYLGRFHKILYNIFYRAFWNVILEKKFPDSDSEYTSDDAYLSADSVEEIQEFIKANNKTVSVSETKTVVGAFWVGDIYKMLGVLEPIPFNKLPKAIFNMISSLRNDHDAYEVFYKRLEIYFKDNEEAFIADLYKSIGAHQMAGSLGPIKTTLCNKLVKSYYDWLTALTIGFSGNNYMLTIDHFDYYVDQMKSFIFYTDTHFKIRNDDIEGFQLVNRGTFEQLFARLQENVKGSFTKESFIVSFHPCDLVTCSLGYNWSSCQSWIDDFTDLPEGYGQGSSYSGAYNRGNFQFLCGNGFVAYIPHEELPGVPQYLWAKKKRCLLWVGDNLDCMRQNYFYPGKPTDQETLSLGKVMREYIQDVCAPFNFSNGTMDWKVKKNCGNHWNSSIADTDFDRFVERYDPCGGRYDDPIMAISYLKTAVGTPTLYYALSFPKLDTGRVQGGYNVNSAVSFFVHTSGVCPICGKHTTRGGICSNCQKEMIEHNGVKVHPSDLVSINVGGQIKYFDINELDKLNDYVVIEDGTSVEFKSAYKVMMPSGIKYFKELPDYVRQCKICKQYFHPSFMIGDVCIEHFNNAISSASADDVVVDVEEVLKAFFAKTLSFDCNDTDNLNALLRLLDSHDVKWVSGKKSSDYVPTTNFAKKMYLSLNNKGRLVLSCQAKSTVIRLSNLFKKGGE